MSASFGAALKAVRLARPAALGQTQRRHRSMRALAGQADLNHENIVRYEQGRRMPSLATFARIARALDLTAEEIAALVDLADGGDD